MAVKLRMVCNTCGSEDVGRDAFAEWDYELQQWVLRGDPYGEQICFNEDCATNGNSGSNIFDEVEETIPDPPTEATRFVHQSTDRIDNSGDNRTNWTAPEYDDPEDHIPGPPFV